MVIRKTHPRASSSKGGSTSTNKSVMRDSIILTTETNEEMEERLNSFIALCGAMNIGIDRQCFDMGTRSALSGCATTKIPRKAFDCNDAIYLMLQQVMEHCEQKNTRIQALRAIYHFSFLIGWIFVFTPYMTSAVPFSVSPTKFSAQVILLLLCMSYLEGWAVYGSFSKINLWSALKTTYRLCFLYIFISEITYAQHLNGLPMVIAAWSFTESIKHAHAILTSYVLSPFFNNKWYQV